MDTQQERDLGVHPSFYIAVALAYLDFLTEREVRSPHIHESAYATFGMLIQVLQSYLAAAAD